MRLRVNRLELVGTDRTVSFEPGLNVISGEITSGKTTLMQLLYGLFGGNLDNLVPEMRHVRMVQGIVLIGDASYVILRRPVSTPTSRVDIASRGEVLRLPALQPVGEEQSYAQWLLRKLGLPELQVAVAPSRIDSPMSPVTISDYLLYCYLKWQEIDSSLLGHSDRFKDQKRRVVFGLVYGVFSEDHVNIVEELRAARLRLADTEAQARNLEVSFQGTPFENRAAITRELDEAGATLAAVEEKTALFTRGGLERLASDARAAREGSRATTLRDSVAQLDGDIARLRLASNEEQNAAERMRLLASQLSAQSRRLAKAIVADEFLDIDFIRCPRCGSAVDSARGSPSTCYLCLQVPTSTVDRSAMEKEQERLDAQIAETEELATVHFSTVGRLREELVDKERRRREAAHELDFATRTYVSDTADQIASLAAERARLQADLRRLTDYLALYDRLDQLYSGIEALRRTTELLDARSTAARAQATNSAQRIRRLEEELATILGIFELPNLGESSDVFIDPRTFMPVVYGRQFDQLHSPGAMVQVNVAHALAHQRTAIALDLKLPNILLIDGLTSNIGREGFDAERKARMYDYLITTSEELGDRLQIIVADNDIPRQAEQYVRLRLSVSNRLVPIVADESERIGEAPDSEAD